MVIRDVYDQIAIGNPGYQKIISFIIRNYYWLGLKKIFDIIFRIVTFVNLLKFQNINIEAC